MDIDQTFKNIRSLYRAISGKNDVDVSLTFKGTEYGVTKPWTVRVDGRESNNETHEGALDTLLETLKKELNDKISSTEQEAKRLRQAFNQLGN